MDILDPPATPPRVAPNSSRKRATPACRRARSLAQRGETRGETEFVFDPPDTLGRTRRLQDPLLRLLETHRFFLRPDVEPFPDAMAAADESAGSMPGHAASADQVREPWSRRDR